MPNDQENQPQPDSQPNEQPVDQSAEQSTEQPSQPMSEPVVETPTEAPAEATPASPAPEATPASPFTAPDPATNPTPAPSSLSNPFKKFSPPVLIGIIVAAAVVLLGGGGAAAYFLYYQNPDKVVFDSISNALTAKSGTFTSAVDFKSDDSGSYNITIDGKVTEKQAAEIAIGAKIENSDGNYTVDGNVMTSEDGDIYLKVNEVQKLLEQFLGASTASTFTTYYGDIINEVDGKWLKISSEDLKSVSEDYGDQQKCLTDVSKKFSSDNSMKNEIENLFKKNRFIKVTKSLGTKDIGGTASLGYELQFDGNKAYEFFKGMADTKLGKDLKDCDKSYDFSNVKKSDFEDTSKATTTVEVWASRFGHQMTELSIKSKEDTESVSIVFNPKFNVPVTVETPENATSIKKVYQDYLDATQSLTSSYSSLYDDYNYDYSY